MTDLLRLAEFLGWWLGGDALLLAPWLLPPVVRRWRVRRAVLRRRVPLLAVDAVLWSFAEEVGAWPAS